MKNQDLPFLMEGSAKYLEYFPLIGRVMIGAIFLLSGFGKLSAPAQTVAHISGAGLPFPLIAYGGAAVIEVGCGLALVVGFYTRAAAIILAAYTLLTACIFHHAFGDQNQFIHFWKNIAIAGGLLQVVAFGPSLATLGRQRSHANIR